MVLLSAARPTAKCVKEYGMAMHKPKKIKRFQPGGLVDSEGRPVRDSSGQPIMTGSFPEEDEITARGRAKNAEMFKSLFNRATGRGKEAEMEAARNKLAGEVQEMVKPKAPAPAAAPKFSDGDVDERDRRMEAAASAPSRMPTRPGQSSSGTKPKPSGTKPKTSTPAGAPGLLDPQQKAQQKDKGPYRDEGRNRPAPAAPAKKPEQSPVTAFPINPGILKQREEAEKKRDAARAAKRKAEEDEKKARPAKEAAERKMLGEQPGAVAYRKKREEEDKMSPGQRSAARGKKIKEFFGMAKGGSVSSASKRADGIAQRGKTRGKVY
jgi:hypothetical protein